VKLPPCSKNILKTENLLLVQKIGDDDNDDDDDGD
jgi:hypothetical protein